MIRSVAPIMVEAGKGANVNISTIGAVQPDLRFPLSAVVRAGLPGLAKLFAERYARDGLRMNNILPAGSTAIRSRPRKSPKSRRVGSAARARARRRCASFSPMTPATSTANRSSPTAGW